MQQQMRFNKEIVVNDALMRTLMGGQRLQAGNQRQGQLLRSPLGCWGCALPCPLLTSLLLPCSLLRLGSGLVHAVVGRLQTRLRGGGLLSGR
eukprot:8468632-Alexandrium_andersonii.AAC.1